MSEKKSVFIFIVINLIIVNGVILAVMNLRYPLVGHDYTLALPSFLDTALHYRLNGLSIQWFTPTFGGGIPAYPNPNNMQFSIPALLATILPPWKAIMVSVVFYVSVGFLACYYFFQHILKFNWSASILGAFFFSANGFVITRVATGQLGYFSFALLALFLIILFDERLPIKIASALFGILFASYMYAAGYFIIIIFGLSILMLIPMVYLYRPELFHTRRILSIIAIGGFLGLIISLSKLAATYSFMRYFPRLIEENTSRSFFIGLLGIILQLLGTTSLVPLFIIGGLDPSTYPNFTRGATGTDFGLWELDISISPIIFVILLICTLKFLHNPRKYLALVKNKDKKTALILFTLFTWIAIEFTLAKGVIYPALRHLPILGSLRGNVRFASAFIFPLIFIVATAYNHWSNTWDRSRFFNAYLLVNLLVALPLCSYFLFNKDMFWMFYDINGPEKIFSDIRAGKSFEIKTVGNPKGHNTGALLNQTTNLNLYDPIFGFALEYFHPQVKPGSIWDISDGYYNMTDPTGYIYPELNHNKPFDRFRVADKQTLELFAKHIQPDWKIPTYQRVLDWISGISFLATLSYVLVQWELNKRNNISS